MTPVTIEARILEVCADDFVSLISTIARRAFGVPDDEITPGHHYHTTFRTVHELLDRELLLQARYAGYLSMAPAHIARRREVEQERDREAVAVSRAVRQLGFFEDAPDPEDFKDEAAYDRECIEVEEANNRIFGRYANSTLTLTNAEFLKLARMAKVPAAVAYHLGQDRLESVAEGIK